MLEKEFVPHQESSELKELGFNEPCLKFYVDGMMALVPDAENGDTNSKLNGYNSLYVAAPTFSQAFRWFREKHLLFSEIKVDRTTEPKFWFSTMKYEITQFLEGWYDDEPSDLYRTYEEAELACLNKLIEIVKGGEQ